MLKANLLLIEHSNLIEVLSKILLARLNLSCYDLHVISMDILGFQLDWVILFVKSRGIISASEKSTENIEIRHYILNKYKW